MLAGTAQAQLTGSGEPLDSIVAVVNEGIVLQSELDTQVQSIVRRLQDDGQQIPPMNVLRDQVLERLIVNRIQLQRAERMGIRISDEVLNNALADVARRNNIAFTQLPEIMASQGIDYAVYREDMREQLVTEQLRQIEVLRRIGVSEREIQQCLTRSEESFGANAEFNLSHILIGVPGSATREQFDEAEREARALYQQLQDGEDFARLAITYSDSQTSLEGGALGWRGGDQIPTLFSGAIREMSAGDVSEPIRSASGFHIIRLNEVRGSVGRSEINQTQVRHILVTPNEVLDDAAARQKIEDLRSRIIGGEDFADLAKLNSDDPGSGNLGGDLGWTNPGTFVPEFVQVMDKLEVGDLSEPFRSRFGWHILEVTGRRVYDNTEEMRRNQCVASMRNARLGEETELWLRRLRDEAYVDKRS